MRKITPGPVLNILFICLFFCGCIKIEHTYTQEKAAESVVDLCLKEYNIPVKSWLIGSTLWIYVPLPRLLDENMNFDKQQLDKVNKVMVSASRVLLSMNPRPMFMAIVSSDIKEYGVDYAIVTHVPDLLKLQHQLISRDEFLRRNLLKMANNSGALGDMDGFHVEKRDFSMKYFVAQQISQRIQQHFTYEPSLKDQFSVEKTSARINGDIIYVAYNIRSRQDNTQVNVLKEIKKIIADTAAAYDLKNILAAKIENLATEEEVLVSRVELKALSR